MRFPRTLRLDSSDLEIFDRAAAPGEPAVPGSFAFAERQPETLDHKERLAFRGAWLGTESFGWSSLVAVAEIDEAEFARLIERLARNFVEQFGAPDLVTALPAAREEADYAASLCDHKLNTLLAIERDWTDRGIAERFRIIKPARARDHAEIWSIVEDDEGGPGSERGDGG